ncbi:MAG: AMP-binding protein, partial [Flammeovirgaceae bacterium]|nr:AMP-binding protein [Flammeovirgaceae bacterium]
MENASWYAHYPKGVPHEINPDQYNSIIELIESSFKKYSKLPAYDCMGASLTYSDVDAMTQQFAAYLQHETKLKPGDRIAIQMPNILQYPIALFGALRAGLTVVNTNPLYTEREMAHQFKDSGAKAIVVLANFASKVEAILSQTDLEHIIVTEIGDLLPFPKNIVVNAAVKYLKKMVPPYNLPKAVPFKRAIRIGASQRFSPVKVKNSDIAFLQYTGGTTGVSKGAMLTHRNMIANMLQISAWMEPFVDEGKEIIITPLPLYHVFALTVNCLSMVRIGARNVLIPNPRDMRAFISELKKYKFSIFTGVNTLFNGLLNQPDFKDLDFSHLKITVGGGMAVQNVVAERWKSVTGTPLVEGFGLTESSPVLTCNPLGGTERIGTIGIPLPSTELKVMDDDGKEVPLGERGELWGRGPQVMKGYWNRPDETAKVLTEDGWLKTGDIATMDKDGFFKIVDRKKNMILVSGFNVYPNELEDVIAKHPKVLEVAAIGVPDAKTGEAIKIFVVKRDESLTQEELAEYCKQQFTGYKVPKYYEFRSELPKTNVGKILHRQLKEEEMAKQKAKT